jgi:hypothetical protein
VGSQRCLLDFEKGYLLDVEEVEKSAWRAFKSAVTKVVYHEPLASTSNNIQVPFFPLLAACYLHVCKASLYIAVVQVAQTCGFWLTKGLS